MSNLIVPEGFVEISKEEMCYVEGGGVIYTWMISAPIDIVLGLCGATIAFSGIKILGKLFGKSLAKSLSNTVAQLVVSVVGGALLNVGIGKVGDLLFGSFWAASSLGNLVGYVLDIAVDGVQNGIVYSW
jgi:hypothetical protein